MMGTLVLTAKGQIEADVLRGALCAHPGCLVRRRRPRGKPWRCEGHRGED